jgi:hypothetical protein
MVPICRYKRTKTTKDGWKHETFEDVESQTRGNKGKQSKLNKIIFGTYKE